MKLVIGLFGYKTAGKTTAYNAFKEILQEAQEITLAEKLKTVCSDVTSVPRTFFDDQDKKEKDLDCPVFMTSSMIERIYKRYDLDYDFNNHVRCHVGVVLETPRRIAQYVGTEMLRVFSADIHCDNAVKGILSEVGIVTDMRFPNELDYFKDKYPRVIPVYVKRDVAEQAAAQDTHSSEKGIAILAKKAEYVMDNNDSKEGFEARIRVLAKSILNDFKGST